MSMSPASAATGSPIEIPNSRSSVFSTARCRSTCRQSLLRFWQTSAMVVVLAASMAASASASLSGSTCSKPSHVQVQFHSATGGSPSGMSPGTRAASSSHATSSGSKNTRSMSLRSTEIRLRYTR
jgi:hypothetical protein